MAEYKEVEQIIAGCKDGSQESFSRLVDIYAGRIYSYFYRLTGDKDVSDELLSELFVKLVEKINHYKIGHFEGWLFKIASNVFHDYLRAKQREKKLINAHKERLESKMHDEKESDVDAFDRLQKQLARLDDEIRELIILRFYSQMSFKEIARMRAEPIGTTLSKLHRGLKKLRELMES